MLFIFSRHSTVILRANNTRNQVTYLSVMLKLLRHRLELVHFVCWDCLFGLNLSYSLSLKRIYFLCIVQQLISAYIYLFKVNNKSTRKMCEICPKSKIKAPKRRQLLVVFLLLTYIIFHTFF